MGFKLTFERKECIRVSDGQREGVPEGRGGVGEGSVPQYVHASNLQGVSSDLTYGFFMGLDWLGFPSDQTG